MSYTDLMIDLETTSTKHNAAIIAIGLVKFNLNNPSVERKTLELLIDENSLTKYDFHTCPETLKWWENQNEDVRNHVFYDQPRVVIEEALDTINEFGKGVYNVCGDKYISRFNLIKFFFKYKKIKDVKLYKISINDIKNNIFYPKYLNLDNTKIKKVTKFNFTKIKDVYKKLCINL
jgi:hypothetical protein